MKRPVYVQLAQLMGAYERCMQGNITQAAMHRERIEEIIKEHMPSGSGFDTGTKLDWDRSHENKLTFNTAFHHMNDVGMYDGWTEHVVTIHPSLAWGFKMGIRGRDRNDIKEYIHETFHHALTQEIDPYAEGTQATN